MKWIKLSVALLAALTAQVAQAEDGWLAQCQEEQGDTAAGQAECFAHYQNKLKNEQSELLTRIRALLSKPGPEGANYAAARRVLNTSQKHWLAYVKADCAVTDESFGQGTAAGSAGEACVNDHYAARNAVLRQHEQALVP